MENRNKGLVNNLVKNWTFERCVRVLLSILENSSEWTEIVKEVKEEYMHACISRLSFLIGKKKELFYPIQIWCICWIRANKIADKNKDAEESAKTVEEAEKAAEMLEKAELQAQKAVTQAKMALKALVEEMRV